MTSFFPKFYEFFMVRFLDLTLPYQKSLHKFGATVLPNELPDKSQFDAVCRDRGNSLKLGGKALNKVKKEVA